jgi:type I restriction enzyme S subunit
MWNSVEQLASQEPRSIQSGPFGSNLLHSEFQDSGILAIGIDNVFDGRFSMGRQNRISLEKYEELKKYTARPLDVVITVMATVGRCCVVPPTIETAIITKHVYRISTNQAIMNPYFLMYSFLGCDEVQKQLYGSIRGQTRPGINGAILKQIKIPIPSLDEQSTIIEEIEARLSVIDKLEETIETSLQEAEALRQSILKQAFAGKLAPQEPGDEPAEALLARIKSNAS